MLQGKGGSRKIPTFNRPGVSITSNAPKKSWKQVQAGTLQPGDILADFGLVHSVAVVDDSARIVAGEREYFVAFPAMDPVMAFTEDAS